MFQSCWHRGGLPLIAAATLDLIQQGVTLRDKERSPEGYSPEKLLACRKFIEASFNWLADEAPVWVGRTVLPEELLTEPPEEIVPAVMQLIDFIGRNLKR